MPILPKITVKGEEGLSQEELWQSLFSKRNIKAVFQKHILPKGGQGVDRISVERFQADIDQQAAIIKRKCISGTYKFSPYLELLQSKGRGKEPRVVSIPTVRDRIVLKILTEYLHTTFSSYIAKDLPNTVIRKIKDKIYPLKKNDRYIKIDLKKFYDSIPHDQLLENIKTSNNHPPFIRLIYRSITNPTLPANYSIKQKKESKSPKGVAQGLSISNILAEIYVRALDEKIKPLSKAYFRFVDDIFILCEEKNTKEIWKEASQSLKKLGLSVSKEKSTPQDTARPIEEGFEFLGYNFSGSVISVRDSSYRKFLESLIGGIIRFKYEYKKASSEEKELKKQIFTEEMNERITGAIDQNRKYGWMFFFSEIDDLAMLAKIDTIVSQTLTRISIFSPDDLKKVKRITRAYYETNHSPKRGYIHNYNFYSTVNQKMDYLIKIGQLKVDPERGYTAEEIDLRFEQAKARNLLKLERDVSTFS